MHPVCLRVCPRVCPTFVSAVPEGARAADGPWSILQGGCAATQWVTLSIQVKGVLGGDTVGTAHAAAAWWQVILADVGGAHCTEEQSIKISYNLHFALHANVELKDMLNYNIKNDSFNLKFHQFVSK